MHTHSQYTRVKTWVKIGQQGREILGILLHRLALPACLALSGAESFVIQRPVLF